MNAVHLSLTVVVEELDADPERIADLTGSLRAELRELDVDQVEPVTTGAAPEGSRGVELIDVGALLVTLAGSGSVLVPLGRLVVDWLVRQRGATIRLRIDGDEIKLTSVDDSLQRTALDGFLRAKTRDTKAQDPKDSSCES